MKIFLSWSGTTSRNIAQLLHKWIPMVLQQAKPFISSNIDKGSRWSVEIAEALQDCDFGISCVTAENLTAPWLLFEAGALSKSVSSDKFAPIIFGLEPHDLKFNPLSQFQVTKFAKEDVFMLILSMNERLGTSKIREGNLTLAFDRFWPDLERDVLSVIPDLSERSKAGDSASEVQATVTNKTADQPPQDAQDEKDSFEIFFTNDTGTFQEKLDQFRKSKHYSTDADFWESSIVRRRRDLGLGGTNDEWHSLASDHPDWIWPQIFLARDALSNGDHDAAWQFYSDVRGRATPDDQMAIDALGVEIAHESGGVAGILSFVRRVVLEKVSDSRASKLISQAINHIKKSKLPTPISIHTILILYEYAVRRNPSEHGLRFSAAYAMAEAPNFDMIAYWHYGQLLGKSGDFPHVENNMGVISSNRDVMDIAIQQFERAVADKNTLSIANLANHLIDSSFIDRAEELLSTVKDASDHIENLSASKNKLEISKRALVENRNKIDSRAENAHKKFSRFVKFTFDHWIGSENTPITGQWANVARQISAKKQDNELLVEMQLDKKAYRATLTHNGLCFEGMLRDNAISLLTTDFKRMFATIAPNGLNVSCLLWLGSDGSEDFEEISLSALNGEK